MSGPEYWERVKSLFATVSELPEAERVAHLARICSDPRMRSDVMELLAADVDGTTWLSDSGLGDARMEFGELPADLEGQQLGRFSVLHRIGSGGMGTVYLAERKDEDLTQQVAIKVLQRGMVNDHAVARFLREREIQARLDHPSICPLYDSGVTDDGRPYFVMPFLEGARPLTQYAREKRLSVRERLRLFREVCEAVHHAHRNLVVHSDLKPGNVLVSSEGRVQLVDFGVSRLLSQEDEELTVQHGGSRPISVDNASPEQLFGLAPTTSSDIYSLGGLLYQLLAGEKPYKIDTTRDYRAQVEMRTDPPRETSSGVMPRDLYQICLKAMRVEPDERYGSVMALVDDIDRWFDDRPVQARAPGLFYQACKFVKRNFWPVASAGTGVAALATVAVVMAVTAARTAEERDRAQATAEFWAHLFEQTDPVHSQEAVPDVLELLARAETELTESDEMGAETRAELLGEVATAYWNLASTEEARRAAEAAAALLEQSGTDNAARAMAYKLAANIAISQMDVEGARKAADRAVHWAERGADLSRAERAQVIEADALVLEVEGKLEEAAEGMERVIALQSSDDRDSAVDQATSYGNLAYMYFNIGREAADPQPWFERADETLARSLEMLREHLGNEHPRVGFMLNATGVINMERGRYPAALEDFDQAAAVLSDSVPPGHEIHSYINYNRGVLFRKLGRMEEAVAAFAATEQAALDGLSSDHPRYREALVGQVRGLLALQQFERAGAKLEDLSGVLSGLPENDPAPLWFELLNRRRQAAASGRTLDPAWLDRFRERTEVVANAELDAYLDTLGPAP